MADEIKTDLLYNLVCNAGAFAEGIERGLAKMDDMERGVNRLGKAFNWASVAIGTFVGHIAADLVRTGVRGFEKFISKVAEAEGVAERLKNLGDIIKTGLGGPLWSTVISIIEDALGRITLLFRTPEGEWTRGFLKLRTTVQVFANWLLSIWQRLTGSLSGMGRDWLDRFVDALTRAIQKAAALLRRFAQFVASIFGGQAPAAVTEAAVAGTRPEAGWEPTATYLPPTAAEPTKAAAKPPKAPTAVAPPSTEDINKLVAIQSKLTQLTTKLAEASERAAKARAAMARAEAALEEASEKVYNIRRKLQALELAWAEIPERFVRGRRRQIQMELAQAEHQEHERQKEADGARDRLQAAESYQREIERTTDALRRQGEQLENSLERQREKYAAYQLDLQEYAADLSAFNQKQAAAAQEAVDQFAGLDELGSEFTQEIEGALLPAFADIELSVASIVDSLGRAWEKAKGLGRDALDFLGRIRAWFDNLPPWAQKILKGAAIAIAFNAVTGGLVTQLVGALASVGLALGPAGLLIAELSILATLIITNKEELAKWFDPRKSLSESWAGQALVVGAQKALEWSPLNLITGGDWGEWANENIIYPVTKYLLDSESDVAAAAETGVEKPVINVFERLSGELVGASIVPEMVDAILGQFDRLQLDLSPIIDGLQGKLNILEKSFAGLLPSLKDFGFASGGNFQVVTVHVTGNTFGDNVDEYQIKDWMFQAIGDLL